MERIDHETGAHGPVTYGVCRRSKRMNYEKRNSYNTPTTLYTILAGMEYHRKWWEWAVAHYDCSYRIRNVVTGEIIPAEVVI